MEALLLEEEKNGKRYQKKFGERPRQAAGRRDGHGGSDLDAHFDE
jgi:hypothetical protein